MLKKIINIVLFATCILIIQSCGSTKKSTSKKTAIGNTKTDGRSEYNAFFKAEKERIKGNKNEARSLYRAFVKSYKTNAAAYYNLSKLEFMSFNFKDAEIYAAKSIDISPKNKYYLEHYADVLSLDKKPRKAVDIYEKLTDLYLSLIHI